MKGRVYRLTKLDACGAPVTGAGSVVVSKFVKIDSAFTYEDGVEFLIKAADGSPCVNQKDDPFLKRVEVDVALCNIDPDGIVIVTGETLITTGTPVTGTGVAFGEELNATRFSLEVWQDVAGAGACSPSGEQQYLYWAYFNLGGAKIQNYSVALAASELSFKAETRAGSAAWGDGPGTGTAWLPAGFSSSGKHYAFNVTTNAPPAAVCGAQALS